MEEYASGLILKNNKKKKPVWLQTVLKILQPINHLDANYLI